MTERQGYRGYIGTRPIMGDRVPQRVQNLVIRDYCQRKGLEFLLSAVEYTMPGCYMMLEHALRELSNLEGLVMYSLFMLPEDAAYRRDVYRRVLDAGGTLHAALEGLVVADDTGIARVEDIWVVQQTLSRFPPPTVEG